MTEPQKTYDEILQELYETHNVEELLSFSEIDLKEKLAINSSKLYHYTELLQKAQNEYNTLLEFRSKLVGEKYHEYKTQSDVLLRQNEIEKYYLPKDPDIIKMNDIISRQKAQVDFFDNIKKSLEKQSWNMQTFFKSMTYGL